MRLKTLLLLVIITTLLVSSCKTTKQGYVDYTKNKNAISYRNSTADFTKNNSRGKTPSTAKTSPSTINKEKAPVIAEKSAPSRDAALTSRLELVKFASTLDGIPYIYGGKNTAGFDCSGFTSYVFRSQGKNLTGNTNMQVKQGKRIQVENAKPGDLLFFGSEGRISHVAIIKESSPDKLIVIHATSSYGVIVQDITNSNYWQPKILYAVDAWENGNSYNT